MTTTARGSPSVLPPLTSAICRSAISLGNPVGRLPARLVARPPWRRREVYPECPLQLRIRTSPDPRSGYEHAGEREDREGHERCAERDERGAFARPATNQLRGGDHEGHRRQAVALQRIEVSGRQRDHGCST